MAVTLGLAPLARAVPLVVVVQGVSGRPVPDAVISLRATDGSQRPVTAVKVIIDQVNRAFDPDLTIIPVGSTVEFPNSDSVSHQIYSFSSAKRFQLPLYRGKPYPPVKFDQPGVVTLGCNIHDSMLAYVVVVDTPFAGKTDAQGKWTTEVPAGTYRVSVWHPRLHEGSQPDTRTTVEDELPEGRAALLNIKLTKPLRPAPLQGSAHSWDAY
ncbi:MAG TPA: hypothetical protein VJQ47_05600 [Steroidobacteraceae bacterium]|nr:hypothetical protein [Steroidobacteraceae bacterium]